MAKTAVLNKETQDLIGIGQSPSTSKLVYEAAGLTEEQVQLVTAKDFAPSDRYATFKDMCLTEAERKDAVEKADKAAADKAAKDAEKAEKAANKPPKAPKAPKPEGAATRSRVNDLTGEYHIVKPFPATAADHPKMPIWTAIAENTTFEAAKAACPEVNPPRKTNGVYTFSSEMGYFLRTGYVAAGAKAEAAAEADVAEENAEGEQAAA